MPVATVRGVDINYEILGERGPWVALQPGGRRALAGVKLLGEKLAESGCRVLVYDRRNCGASGVSFDGGGSENEIWAEDLRALLSQLDALPAYIGGSSSGCRLALLMALRHPADVHGLLLWRVTGGAHAAQRLVEDYYTQFIHAAQQGGLEAVRRTEHFSAVIACHPPNRARPTPPDPPRFIGLMADVRNAARRSGRDGIAHRPAGAERSRASARAALRPFTARSPRLGARPEEP